MNTVYILRPELDIFEYSKESVSDIYYRILKTSPSQKLKDRLRKNKTTSVRDPLVQKDVFFPLGKLYQVSKAKTDKVVLSDIKISYFVGLNISTKPQSLWLIQDYRAFDEKFGLAKYDDSNDKVTGFLDLGFKFDVGKICSDVTLWHADCGLEIDEVKDCLRENHFNKGKTLYLKAYGPKGGERPSKLQ